MTIRRWQVRVHQSHKNGSKSPKSRWVVDPPGFDYTKRAEHTGNWHRAGGKWFQWGGETTKREAWEQALAYADKMSRTVRIELPRVHGPWRTAGIFDEQNLAPLTLALLAAAQWAEQEPS